MVGLSLALVCLSVYAHNIPKIDKARIAKLNVEMYHYECWKTIYLWVKR